MRFFGPKHTPESVAAQLIEGLENGTITLDEPEEETGEPPAAPSELLAPEGSGALFAASSLALSAVATAVVSTVLLLTTSEPPLWAFVVACFAACLGCAAGAFRLGTTAAVSIRVPNAPNLPAHEPGATDEASESRPA